MFSTGSSAPTRSFFGRLLRRSQPKSNSVKRDGMLITPNNCEAKRVAGMTGMAVDSKCDESSASTVSDDISIPFQSSLTSTSTNQMPNSSHKATTSAGNNNNNNSSSNSNSNSNSNINGINNNHNSSASTVAPTSLLASLSLRSGERDHFAKELDGSYDSADMVIGVASHYFSLAQMSSQIPNSKHSASTRSLSWLQRSSGTQIHMYILRMVRILNEIYDKHDETLSGLASTGIRVLVIASTFIQRLLVNQPDFIIHSLNLHNVLAGAMVAAIKFIEDVVPDKKLFAMIVGMTTKQVQKCEMNFCRMCKYQFWIKEDEYREHHEALRSRFCVAGSS